MDAVWAFIKLDLFLSIPEAYAVWWVSLAIFGFNPRQYWKPLSIIVLISSVYTDLLVPILPLPIHMVNSLVTTFLLLWWQFHTWRTRRRLGIFLVFYTVAILTDVIAVLLNTYLFDIVDRTQALTNDSFYTMISLYPVLILNFLLAALLQRRSKWVHRINARLLFTKLKGMLQIFLLLLLQLFSAGTVLIFHLTYHNQEYRLLLQTLILTAILINLFTIAAVIRVIARTREHSARATQELYIEQISGMFTSIRGQRHDFLNHVQVMYTMLKMGKTAELEDYMAEVVKETHDVGEIVHHASPAIAAFVKAKTAIALTRNIVFTYELSEKWDPQSIVKTIDIIKIVGNLVNNAFEAVDKLPPEERKVHIVIRLDADWLELDVANAGPLLTAEQCEQLFRPGYTTKLHAHDGLGLAIVQERVAHYQGKISLLSDSEQGTLFRILLPLKQLSAS